MSAQPEGRPLRVVVLSHVGQLSGAELGLARILPFLHNVRAHVILAEQGPLVGRLSEAGVSVEVFPMGEATRGLRRERVRPDRPGVRAAWETLVYSVRLARRLRSLRPDLVHANSLKALVYGSIAARLAGLPVLWHAHDRIAEDYLPRPAVRLIRSFARLATVVVANSQSTRESLGAAGSRAVVIPYAVVPSAMPRGATDPLARPVHVGIVGRISPWKGQHVFLEAFARAFPRGEERAVIVGTPLFGEIGYEAQLRTLCGRLELEDRVEFRGFQENIGDELAHLDVLVHASIIPEPFGQVVAEGMGAGLPVVAAGAGGPAEILTDESTGFLYPPGDVNALAQRLRRLAQDPDLRRRIGQAARARTTSFAPELIAARLTSAYDLTVRGGRRSA